MFGVFKDSQSGQEYECMKECSCVLPKKLLFLKEQMPSLYADADLQSIQPWSVKHAKQSVVLDKVKESPFASYLFLGNSGVGKSYIAWALWKHAAANGRATPLINSTAELMLEYKDFVTKDEADRPAVLPADLTQSQIKYTILLDEVDKFKVTEFTLERFFELIKAAVDYQHQLIVTSNINVMDLKKKFSLVDAGQGSAIMRRLLENTKLVEMWK